MKLSTRIAQSRHGVYYYRHQFTEAGKRREKRFSLNTKNPVTAKKSHLQHVAQAQLPHYNSIIPESLN
ncbi:hypothetical protein [Bordetella ansorpii]|uniref:hypothetical protein n=1 Tax=Bordetella ansorpii TaxID=288768 RepID=UPI000AC8B5F1|nr:hypothetical protein [Bordetella ansorpii]